MIQQQTLEVSTRGRSTQNITPDVNEYIAATGIQTGLCHLFIQHTSASLIITENADPDVRTDLEMIMQRLAPDGDPDYRHDMEGDDDMAMHTNRHECDGI